MKQTHSLGIHNGSSKKNLSAAWLQEENVTLEPVDHAFSVAQDGPSIHIQKGSALSSMHFSVS